MALFKTDVIKDLQITYNGKVFFSMKLVNHIIYCVSNIEAFGQRKLFAFLYHFCIFTAHINPYVGIWGRGLFVTFKCIII